MKFIKTITALILLIIIHSNVNNTVYADWKDERVIASNKQNKWYNNDPSYVLEDENAIPDNQRLTNIATYYHSGTKNSILYLKIPLTNILRIAISQFLGIDIKELDNKPYLMVEVITPGDSVSGKEMVLRPQYVFSYQIPALGLGLGIDDIRYPIQTEDTPHNEFNINADVKTDTRVFGPGNGIVSEQIRDAGNVSIHTKWCPPCPPFRGHWSIVDSPDNLHLGFNNDNQCRTVLSFVDFHNGVHGTLNNTPFTGRDISKQLTLTTILSHEAWMFFKSKVYLNGEITVTSSDIWDYLSQGFRPLAGESAAQATYRHLNEENAKKPPIGAILLDMFRNDYITAEVMHYFLGFTTAELQCVKPGVQPSLIIPAPLRSAAPPPHIDSDPIPVVTTTSPVNVSTSATPSFRTLSKTWPRPLPAVTPQFEMSSGIPDDEELLTVYRVYNRNNGFHHYTMDRAEVDYLVSIGWLDEGEAFKCNKQGVPVYRLYNRATGIHHFTTNSNERDDLVNNHGWEDEGIAWYARTEGIPVYRIYNPGNGEHVWTTSRAEVENAVAHGWHDEGIAWYM
ncbi:MAG: hypothetical protein LBI41_03380 [Lactobacillales bacterium]|nr:hypothetical protein [Lactobacillales bacterium]